MATRARAPQVRRMLRCAHHKFAPPAARGAFELYGADVMLDEDWRPVLLEVNRSPRVLDMDRPVSALMRVPSRGRA